MTAMLVVDRVAKRYGGVSAIRDLSLSVARGELVSLLGPSGCGKTTLLRMIAGFVEPDAGAVTIAGRLMRGDPPARRNIGLVFQNYSLWPHMTVFDNIAFGLDCRGLRGETRRRRVEACLDLVRLGGYARRLPRELSGGQQQRVALARALAYEPDLLLLDEPLSALDRRLREDLQSELRRLQREVGVTTILVTHDQDEALALSTRIAVMAEGRIEQVDAPETVYRAPATVFVAGFVGRASFLEGDVLQGSPPRFRGAGLDLALSRDPGWSGPARLMIRPEAVALRPPAGGLPTAVVTDREYHGALVHLTLRLASGVELLAASSRSEDGATAPGRTVEVSVDADRATAFARA